MVPATPLNPLRRSSGHPCWVVFAAVHVQEVKTSVNTETATTEKLQEMRTLSDIAYRHDHVQLLTYSLRVKYMLLKKYFKEVFQH